MEMQLIEPMLLSEMKEPFDDENYAFEFKLDGVRMLAYKQNDVRLFNRSNNEKTNNYPEIIKELQNLPENTIIDGEIVAIKAGKQDFYEVLSRDHAKKPKMKNDVTIFYGIFDVLKYAGEDYTIKPYVERRKLLKTICEELDPSVVACAISCDKQGKMMFEAAVRGELEGIVAKKKDSLYSAGTRSPHWIKIKNIRTMPVYIGGFSIKTRPTFAVGIYIGADFKYIGNVSNGLREQQYRELLKDLEPLKIAHSPFDEDLRELGIQYTQPKLSLEINYLEVSSDNKLRQPTIVRINKAQKEQNWNS